MKLILNSIAQILLDDVAASADTSDAFATPARSSYFTWQTIFGVAPSAINITIEGSLDNSNWSVIDTSTVTTGEVRSFASSMLFVRAKINTATGGSGVTVSLVAKPYYNPPFNQNLNTTNSPEFAGLTLTGVINLATSDPSLQTVDTISQIGFGRGPSDGNYSAFYHLLSDLSDYAALQFRADVTNPTTTINTSLWARGPNGYISINILGSGAFNLAGGAISVDKGYIFPTSDPMVVGAWWNNAGTLTISAAV